LPHSREQRRGDLPHRVAAVQAAKGRQATDQQDPSGASARVSVDAAARLSRPAALNRSMNTARLTIRRPVRASTRAPIPSPNVVTSSDA